MLQAIFIAAFGLIGVFSRYYLGLFIPKFLGPPFPYATFLINVVGAFIIGTVYVLGVERAVISPDLRVGIIVGLLGGFTTFSSYCLEAVRLAEQAEYFYAALYILLSNGAGLVATFGGILLTRKLLSIVAWARLIGA